MDFAAKIQKNRGTKASKNDVFVYPRGADIPPAKKKIKGDKGRQIRRALFRNSLLFFGDTLDI